MEVVFVCEVIQYIVEENKESEDKILVWVCGYVMEIVVDYLYIIICVFELFFNWLWNCFYDGICLYNLDNFIQVVCDYEIIYVFCYCSYIDYLLLLFVVYCNGLVLLYIVVGINLNLLVVGIILCCGGVFFMCCSFCDNLFYVVVFYEYLYSIIIQGFFIEYFVEGGCSCSGCML